MNTEYPEQRIYLDLINKSGLRKGFIANKMEITNVVLSMYINGRKELPIEHKKQLDEILNNY